MPLIPYDLLSETYIDLIDKTQFELYDIEQKVFLVYFQDFGREL